MNVKLNRIQITATDNTAQSFDINTIEQLSECINNQHNIDQLEGALYFDNKQKLFFEDKQTALGAIIALHATDIIHLNLLSVA